MKKFSERKGYKKASELIQKEGMSDELRNSLWNILYESIWSYESFIFNYEKGFGIDAFSKSLWLDFLKKPLDSMPGTVNDKIRIFRDLFFESEWHEVYDFIEYISQFFKSEDLQKSVNTILEREFSGYRLIDHVFADITDEQEIKMLDETLNDDRFEGVSQHLKRALELLADRENPDYRNSIKESISAVESICQIITKKGKATLPDALKTLEKDHKLHSALKDGFVKLYGYTSDKDGIRHAMSEESDLDSADAKYFLISCTSFINYLKSRI